MTKDLSLLIVDDEPLVRAGIRNALSFATGIEILEDAESGAAAVDAICRLQPDIVLLDVQLQDMTGLEVAQKIPSELTPVVIFLTAYDEYAVQAFEVNAIDYVLKPFEQERLMQSIARARERIQSQARSNLAARMEELLAATRSKWPQRIVVRNGDRYDVVRVDAVEWIESADNYSCLHSGGKSYLLNETLTSLASRLDPVKFIRVHRRRIINVTGVVAVHPMFGGVYEVELRDGTRLGTGRQFRDIVESFLKNS